ncbi:MAG: hypothetical protein IJ087_00230 [Eggerthellaceae bacterium]|nr:hypothetical protein [Eggerthellaceae bacterium]
MRDYCRVYHTSIDYLANMTMTALVAELEDAAAELSDERKRREKQLEKERARARSRRRHRG